MNDESPMSEDLIRKGIGRLKKVQPSPEFMNALERKLGDELCQNRRPRRGIRGQEEGMSRKTPRSAKKPNERVKRTRGRVNASRVPQRRAGRSATKESKGWWLHTAAAVLLIAAAGLVVWQPWKGSTGSGRAEDPDAEKVAEKPSSEKEEQLIQGLMSADAAVRESAMKQLSEEPVAHWEFIKRLAQHDHADVRAGARAVVTARLDVLGSRVAELETAKDGALKVFAREVGEDLWEGRFEYRGAESGKMLVALGGLDTLRLREGERFGVSGNRPAILRLADGSRVKLKAGSEGVARGRTQGLRQVFELTRGSARFKVEKGDGGFRVETPSGKVTVLGTEFDVELRPGAQRGDGEMTGRTALTLVVAVIVGSVQVDWSGGKVTLSAGQSQVFAAEGSDAAGNAESHTGKVIASNTGVKFHKTGWDGPIAVKMDEKGKALAKFNGKTVTIKAVLVKKPKWLFVVTECPKENATKPQTP